MRPPDFKTRPPLATASSVATSAAATSGSFRATWRCASWRRSTSRQRRPTIRKEISEKELANTRAQIENAKTIDDVLKTKYSSVQLYRYLSGQLLSLYFRTYQLALEIAKGAERCFQFELGQPAAAFIEPAYWDTAKKGLLAGEQLHLDLRRMDLAYLESHTREYEITKHVSLVQTDPLALIALRQIGRCQFAIPEVLYDLDCPGHYMRRIKSVGITIPCVTGPYAGVYCTLTLLSSSVRKNADGQTYAKTADDPRFAVDFSSIQSIVTSGAQADSGMFETNLREERYLPFEGAGAISTWRLELPSEIRQFDYDTISDVILHVRYTAREGGAGLKRIGGIACARRDHECPAGATLLGTPRVSDGVGEVQRRTGSRHRDEA